MGRAGALLAGLLALSGCAAAGTPTCPEGTAPGVVTSLFFGLSRRGGADVGEGEWRAFLADYAAKRLPGLTVSDGLGLFREPDGTPVSERAKVVVTAHHGLTEEVQAIADVTAEYKRRFDQWGVGRIDQPACTNFD
ncbi:MAG TPA: DUF3574 domain-containing protein [Azospirillum sp.]|nr:DUF3574 domain-containing protein [Azospirillum sp.]